MSNKTTAQNTLCYYFRLLGKESGVGWNSDNDSEIASIVETIFGEIEKLRKEVEELKAQSVTSSAAALGSITSERKAKSSAVNGRNPVKPGSNPRGRPRKAE